MLIPASWLPGPHFVTYLQSAIINVNMLVEMPPSYERKVVTNIDPKAIIEYENTAAVISDIDCLLCGFSDHPYLGVPVDSIKAHGLCTKFAKAVINKKSPINKQKFDAEVAKAQDVICVFCSKPGASAGCWKPDCSVKFHLPCSVGQEIVNRHDIFMSYCRDHSRKQEDVEGEHQCGVCGWLVGEGENFDSLVTTCCDLKHHRGCLQVNPVIEKYLCSVQVLRQVNGGVGGLNQNADNAEGSLVLKC